MQPVWFYEDNGQRVGPSTEAQVIQLLKSARISGATPVWKQGFNDWLKIEDTELGAHLQQAGPPPLSGSHVNNNITWTLAIAPIIGLFLEYFVAGAVTSNEYAAEEAVSGGKYWFITLALNVALSYVDEMRLKAAGHDTSKFRGVTWLVPVYLYQRAKHLRQTPSYFWVWIACFVYTLI